MLCLVKTCKRESEIRGFCDKHYRRFKKHGDPLFVKIYPEICTIKTCDRKHRAKGYCEKHYYRFKKYGDPLIEIRIMGHDPICTIEGCKGKYKARGLCRNHYMCKWFKEHPEVMLKSSIKYLTKMGKSFDMTSKEYGWARRNWAKTTKKHDNYTCQVCGKKGTSKSIHAHHLLFASLYPKLSLNISNGTSLCIPCHEELHGYETY